MNAPVDNSEPTEQTQATDQAVCGMCAFFVQFQMKGGPAAIGRSQVVTECRRGPPSSVPILGLPLDALKDALKTATPGIIGAGAQMRSGPQMAVLQPVSVLPVYPPVPPAWPACGEFQPNAAILAEAEQFMADQQQQKGGTEN